MRTPHQLGGLAGRIYALNVSIQNADVLLRVLRTILSPRSLCTAVSCLVE